MLQDRQSSGARHKGQRVVVGQTGDMVGEGIESHGTEGNRKRGALSLGSSKCRGGVDRSEEEVKCAGLYVRSRGRVRFDLGFKVARVAQECYAANKRERRA
jgi:hypothetical protein